MAERDDAAAAVGPADNTTDNTADNTADNTSEGTSETAGSSIAPGPLSDIREIRKRNDAIPYTAVGRAAIQTGDLLCFSGKGFGSWVIRTATRSIYSHCGIALRYKGRVYCLEAIGSSGVRLALMSVLMEHYEGGIDHFDVPGASDEAREAAIGFGFEQLGKVYDRAGIIRFAKAILFKKKSLVLEDQEWFCSELVAAAFARAGLPLVELQAAYTSPEDLAKSPRVQFRASLKK